MIVTVRSRGLPVDSGDVTPAGLQVGDIALLEEDDRSVWARMAATSLAEEVSPAPIPTDERHRRGGHPPTGPPRPDA
jgi:hypothetical protein